MAIAAMWWCIALGIGDVYCDCSGWGMWEAAEGLTHGCSHFEACKLVTDFLPRQALFPEPTRLVLQGNLIRDVILSTP